MLQKNDDPWITSIRNKKDLDGLKQKKSAEEQNMQEREQFTINSSINDSECVHKTKLHILLVWHKNSPSLCLPYEYVLAPCIASAALSSHLSLSQHTF